MRQAQRRFGSAVAVLAAMTIAGCSSNRRGPMIMSLTGMSSESRTYRGTVVDQTEFVSVDGLLGTPAPGLLYHTIDQTEQQSLLGISYDTKSFVLIGESAPPDRDFAEEVSRLKVLIEEHDAAQSKLLRTTAELVTLERKTIALLDLLTRQAFGESEKETNTADAARSEIGNVLASLRNEADETRSSIRRLDRRIESLASEIREASSLPGIIIGKWRRNDRGHIAVRALPLSSATNGGSSDLEGYVILGGVRIVVPFFSMDASTMFLDIEEASPGSLKSLKLASATTYLLQAKEVAYTNSSTRATYRQANLTLKPSNLSDWASVLSDFQEVSLEATFASAQQNVGGGRMGKFQWRKVDLNFSDRWNKPPDQTDARAALRLRRTAQNDLLAIAGATCSEDFDESGEWMTVVGQVMSFGRMARILISAATWGGRPGDVTRIEHEQTGGRPPSLIEERPRRITR